MAAVVGTITSAIQVQGGHAGIDQSTIRKAYLVTLSTAIYTASADTLTITGAGAAISALTRRGVTLTLRSGTGAGPGVTAAGAAAYINPASAVTISTDTVTAQMGATQDTNTAAATGVSMLLVCDEGVVA